MNYYKLTAVVNGQDVRLKRSYFSTRSEAINYMFDYYEKHYLYGLEVMDEHPVDGNKHDVEYVCDFHNRFTITRNHIEA